MKFIPPLVKWFFLFFVVLSNSYCEGSFPIALERLIEQLPEWQNGSRKVQIEAIKTGLTNHNFKVIFPNQTYFVRLGSDNPAALGLNSDREYFCTQAAASLGIAPGIVKYLPEEHAMAFHYIASKGFQKTRANYQRILSLLRRFHQSEITLPSTFCPYEIIQNYYRTAMDLRGLRQIPSASFFLSVVEEIRAALPVFKARCPCHLDLYSLNFLDDGANVFIVDWEYSAMADPLFDLATLVESDNLSIAEMHVILELYLESPTREDFAYLYLMSILAHIRMGLWSCIQAEVSQIEANYLDFAEDSFEKAIYKTTLPHYQESLLLLKLGKPLISE